MPNCDKKEDKIQYYHACADIKLIICTVFNMQANLHATWSRGVVPECDDDADDGSPAHIAVAEVALFGRLPTGGIFLAALGVGMGMGVTVTESG